MNTSDHSENIGQDSQDDNEDSTTSSEDDEDMEEDESQQAQPEEDCVSEMEEKDETSNNDDRGTEIKTYLPGQALGEDEELVMDEGAYLVYHQASLGPPCLSFDIIPDDLGDERDQFPLTFYGVAGTQSGVSHANSIVTFKMHNLHPITRQKQDSKEEEEESEDEEVDNEDKAPRLNASAIKHFGCVNRLAFKFLGVASVVAAWSENGRVAIWSLDRALKNLEESSGSHQNKTPEEARSLFEYAGHPCEGYALNWNPNKPGSLATGDCEKNIFVWNPTDDGSWSIGSKPLVGHTGSVEDLRWSPNEATVLCSGSVDRSLRIWDVRASPDKACMLTVGNAHERDINVIDWNHNEPFVVSGGDDGLIKVWDLRVFQRGDPVAMFRHHKGPVTSVEWHPTDSTVLASSGEDNQIALWDLALETDDGLSNEPDAAAIDLPPQLLFIHQGFEDVKEIHWHSQIPGLLISTSRTGFDVFRTISV